jgi:predicted nuclease with RNAse H fold
MLFAVFCIRSPSCYLDGRLSLKLCESEKKMASALKLSGVIVGYDPGGNGTHGLAILHIKDGKGMSLKPETMRTTEAVIHSLKGFEPILAIGVDTLTCWSTGESGWRPADRWLREHYPNIANSIISPNALRGAMCLNGMAVLMEVRGGSDGVTITETHPKALSWPLLEEMYDYENNRDVMDKKLSRAMGLPEHIVTANEHEWDAAASALAAFKGISGRWSNDLHNLLTRSDEHLVWPCGKTKYYWPE